jgi:hypothetical protein
VARHFDAIAIGTGQAGPSLAARFSTGRTKIGVIWDLSVKRIDDRTCEFTNTVHSSATPELMDFLGKQGIPWEVFKSAGKPISQAHNRQETPLFAESIERHALRNYSSAGVASAEKVI